GPSRRGVARPPRRPANHRSPGYWRRKRRSPKRNAPCAVRLSLPTTPIQVELLNPRGDQRAGRLVLRLRLPEEQAQITPAVVRVVRVNVQFDTRLVVGIHPVVGTGQGGAYLRHAMTMQQQVDFLAILRLQ